jgi:hypothetical protein
MPQQALLAAAPGSAPAMNQFFASSSAAWPMMHVAFRRYYRCIPFVFKFLLRLIFYVNFDYLFY